MARWDPTPIFNWRATSTVNTVSIPGLDGDADGMYRLYMEWFSVDTANLKDINWVANGGTRWGRSRWRRDAPPYTETKTQGMAFGFNRGGQARFTAIINASRYPRGSTVPHYRNHWSLGSFWTYFAGDSNVICRSFGFFDNLDNNITSIDIFSSNSKSITKSNQIQANSTITLWKLAE